MIPGTSYRYAVKKGMEGQDVWAIQLGLNEAYVNYRVIEDGVFGPQTEKLVKVWQRNHGLAVDGVAGGQTQRSLAMWFIGPTEKTYNLPRGLLKGLAEGESSFILGCVNWSASGGVDCGLIQDRVVYTLLSAVPEQRWHDAFSPKISTNVTGAKLRKKKDDFYGKPGAKTHQRAWELALLYHNWESGAVKLANGGTLSNEPAQWVIDIGVTGVTTPAQWANFYIETKTMYVTSWDIP